MLGSTTPIAWAPHRSQHFGLNEACASRGGSRVPAGALHDAEQVEPGRVLEREWQVCCSEATMNKIPICAPKGPLGLVLALLVLGAWLPACGTGGGVAPVATELPRLGAIYREIANASTPDSDGDGIPDEVELAYRDLLGLNASMADTDGDGMNDLFEIFGASWLYAQTRGQAGTLDEDARSLEGANDPATTNRSALVDSDGDGVPDYHEFFGYRYDRTRREFVGDPAGFRTDPLQWSSDLDAYSDGAEVSGIDLDPAIAAPGNHPLVPACPDIVVEVQAFEVTMNDTVIYARGGAVAKGDSWSRGTSRGPTDPSRLGLAAAAASPLTRLPSRSFALGAPLSGDRWTGMTSAATASGTTVNPDIDWNRARSFNPAAAAHLRLFLRVHNQGLAPVRDLVPTLHLSVAGAEVATFEPAGSALGLLTPGATFPAAARDHWVVDSLSSGAGHQPIALTDYMLRALESGAPLSIAVTRSRGEVVSSGDIEEYVARCAEASATIFLAEARDPLTGALELPRHRLVHASGSVTAPTVTLRDALAWSMGLKAGKDDYSIQYPAANGTVWTVSLGGGGGWRIHLDEATLRHNWAESPAETTSEEFLGMRLLAGSRVALRPPREPADGTPAIYCASAEPFTQGGEVVACVGDYDGIEAVVFVDKEGVETAMSPDGRGSMFFSCRLDPDYAFEGGGREVVRATAAPGALGPVGARLHPVAEAAVESLYTAPSEPPNVVSVRWDPSRLALLAAIEPGGHRPEDEIAWVRLISNEPRPVETEEARPPYLSMTRPVDAPDDAFAWEAVLPDGWASGLMLVASTAGGQVATRMLHDMQNLVPHGSGRISALEARIAWQGSDTWKIRQIDLDLSPDAGVLDFATSDPHFNGGWPSDGPDHLILDWKRAVAPARNADLWQPAHGMADLYLRSRGEAKDPSAFLLGFHMKAMPLLVSWDPLGGDAFFYLGQQDIIDLHGAMTPGRLDSAGSESCWTAGEGALLVFVTSDGRQGKLRIRHSSVTHDGWRGEDAATLVCDYLIFRKAGDGAPPEEFGYETTESHCLAGSMIPANRPRWKGDPPDSYSIAPTLPDGLHIDPASGVIRGVAVAASARARYVVTAENTGGSVEAEIFLTVE